MNTFSTPAHTHDPSISGDVYDPDEVVPQNSPLLQARRLSLRPSPSTTSSLEKDEDSPPNTGREGNSSKLNEPNPGDAVLVTFLGVHQDIASIAGRQPLQPDTPVRGSSRGSDDDSGDDVRYGRIGIGRGDRDRDWDWGKDKEREKERAREGTRGKTRSAERERGPGRGDSKDSMSVETCPPPEAAPVPVPLDDLQSLATSALGALAFGGHRAEISEHTRRTPTNLDISSLDRDRDRDRNRERDGERDRDRDTDRGRGRLSSITADGYGRRDGPLSRDRERDERGVLPGAPSPYSPHSTGAYSHSPLPPSLSPMSLRSPTTMPRNMGDPLPPIQAMASPRSETSAGHNPLPSIRDALGDMSFNDGGGQEGRHGPSFPHSPPGAGLPRIHAMGGHGSPPPPMSPNEHFRGGRGDLPSPAHHLSAVTSPYYPHHPQANGYPPTRHSVDYSSSSATETPGSVGDHATPGAPLPPLGPDGLPTMASFVCQFPGCNALPFQTQYLLNSHANVHSSARPHYCPVKGCPRSEGGKGFKRKNEMIRHGLVHDSPGYVCPFCPDREHKYPRPDNLQRHVRVHHMDKDKDDPLLRDVLAQRPDGPNRGRRRRHGPS